MKKIIVISYGQRTSDSVCQQIKRVLGDDIPIKGLNINDSFQALLDEDTMLVVTSEHIEEHVRKTIQESTEYIVAKRVINYKYIKEVIKLEPGRQVLLVNDHKETCFLTIEQLEKHGMNHVTYIPYYPGCKYISGPTVAVTPNESHLVPKDISKIIDIGTRQIDIVSIFEVAKWLRLPDSVIDTMSSEFVFDIVEQLKDFNQLAKAANDYQKVLKNILDHSRDGILYCDQGGKIIAINKPMNSIMDLDESCSMDTLSFRGLFQVDFDVFISERNGKMTKIAGIDYLVDVAKLENMQGLYGYSIALKNVQSVIEDGYDIRRQHRKGKYKGIYTFNDIKGNSQGLKKCVKLSQKLALSKSTVLIEGESGTGKELFAQSMHQYSNRVDEPFVAVNCASLTPSLLESELFGYEKGTFTGADKNGKAGLFEQAHKGTIFLDEIGDTSLELQAKLLRVLQEKEVRRIGGEKTIPIDVRVIAATNKKLKHLVDEGGFRSDLFYRLNVLPLIIPPIRNRPGDIKVLIEAFIRNLTHYKMGIEDYLEEGTMDYLEAYDWPGNVREILNVAEYFTSIKESDKLIAIEDLPYYFNESTHGVDQLEWDVAWVLKLISISQGIGRRRIAELAQLGDLPISEGKVRKILDQLSKDKFIVVKKGVRGAVVTLLGVRQLE